MNDTQVIEIVMGPGPEATGQKAPETTAAAGITSPAGLARGPGDSPGPDKCECPECGLQADKEPGEPCRSRECPECGATMQAATGQGEEKCNEPRKKKPQRTKEEAGSDKLAMLRAVKDSISGLLEQLKAFVGWGDYEGLQEVLEDALEPEAETRSAFKTFEGTDGQTWILTWTTNAFEDREREIFTTKALEEYVTRHADDETKGVFLFWHIPGTKFADIKWQGMSGRFLVEAGPFDAGPVGQAFKRLFTGHPNGLAHVAPLGWGASHGYVYQMLDREDGVYNWFDKKETTILPAHVAANPFTGLEVVEMALSAAQKQALAAIGGEELVRLVEAKGAAMTKELEEAGVAFKSTDATDESFIPPSGGGFSGQILQVAAQVDDPEVAERLKAIAAELEKPLPDIKADKQAGEEDEEDEEEIEVPETPPGGEKQPPTSPTEETEEEEEEEEEAEKAVWTTAYKNDLPDSAFLYVEPGEKDEGGKTVPRTNRHLPYKNKEGQVDLPHLRNAISRLGQPATGEAGGEDWLTEDLRQRLQKKAQGILARESKGLNRIAWLAGRLGGISERVGGEKGMYLGAIATAMHQVSEADPGIGESTETETAAEKQLAPPALEGTGTGEGPPAMDVKGIVTTIADALQLDALSETISGMRAALADLEAKTKALEEENAGLRERLADAEKSVDVQVAEKELELPRFSWFHASRAAQTVLEDNDRGATKAVQSGNIPATIGALVKQMGGGD